MNSASNLRLDVSTLVDEHYKTLLRYLMLLSWSPALSDEEVSHHWMLAAAIPARQVQMEMRLEF